MTTSGSHPPDPARQPGQYPGSDQTQITANGPEPRSARDRETSQLGQLQRLGPDLASAAWPAFLAAGIGAIIIGAILLAWPKETLTVVAILIGAALIVAGILRLIDGFTAHESSGGKRVASVVIGLIAVILGLYCIRHYHLTITALAIIVGLFWVIHGISDITAGLFIGRIPGRWLTVLSGVLSLAAGLVVLFWPTISITVFVAVIGIWLIVYGVIAAALSFSLRRGGRGGTGSAPGRPASV
jgi:uncharacterized membrane protein HdeD (DUF308 family)